MRGLTSRTALIALLAATAVLASFGLHVTAQDDEPITLPVARELELKEGEGRDTVVNNCLKCHTMKPIITHDGLTDEAWASEVDKMRTRYGAQITDEDAAIIVTYLQTYYSDEPPSSDNILLFGMDNAYATPRAGEAEAGASPVATPAQQASD